MRGDLPAIVNCLNRNLARKQFAVVHRVGHFLGEGRWRGVKIGDFRIAERNGKIIGVIASWDQSAFKQTRIVGYSGRWKWLAPLSRWAAPIRRAPGLPRPGECLPFFHSCCIAVDNDDPEIFRALLREVYNAHTGGPWLYFMVGLHERDPLAVVLQEYARIPFVGRLFAVTLGSDQSRRFDDRVPSIETATL